MQRANHLALMLSLAVVLVLGQLMGCAAAGKPEAAEPEEAAEAAADTVQQTLQAADQAFQNKHYGQAAELYASLQKAEDDLTPEQQKSVQARLERIDSILHQQQVQERAAISRGQAPAALEEVKGLCDDGNYEEAAAKLQVIEELWDELPVTLRLRVDELRNRVSENTDALPALTKKQKVHRAKTYMSIGLDARDQGNYALAAPVLDAAESFDVSLGLFGLGSRRLHKARQQVHEKLSSLRLSFQAGKSAHQAGDYETATGQLGRVVEANIQIGEGRLEEARQLLAEAQEKLEQQQRAIARQETEKATGLLGEAESLVEQEEYEEAASVLAELHPLENRLDEGQKARVAELRRQVLAAGGPLVAATEQEKRQIALDKLEEGLAAYEQNRYVDAKEDLDAVAAMDVDLGRSNTSRLRKARSEVTQQLERLHNAFEKGMAAYRQQDYATARENLQMVAGSGVQIGGPMKQQAADTLAAIQEESRRGEMEEVAQRQKEAEAIQQRAGRVLDVLDKVSDLLALADNAINAGDLEEAREALKEADGLLQTEGVKGTAAAAELAQKIDAKMAVVASVSEKRIRREKAQEQVATLIQEAENLADTDLGAAEGKVHRVQQLAAAEGISLTAEQQKTLDEIEQKIRREFGLQRSLAQEQARQVPVVAKEYASRGEYQKAVDLLQPVEKAPSLVADEELKRQATNMRVQMQQEAADQEAAAERIIKRFDEARQLLEQKELKASMYGAILSDAQEKGLAGQALMDVYEAGVRFLEEDVNQRLNATRPDYGTMAAEILAEAELRMHRQLAEWYLQNDAPGLAEPHLQALQEQGAGSSWAEEKLANLASLRTAAENARLRAIAGEVDEIYRLAEELENLLNQGLLSEARSVQQRLWDARVKLAVKKAEMALARGDWQGARSILDEAPVEDTSASAPADYQEVREKVDCRATVAKDLEEARAAIAAGQLEKASGRLQSVGEHTCRGPAQEIKLNHLAAVLEPVRVRKADWAAMRAWQQRTLAKSRGRLKELQRRHDAWETYRQAVEALVVHLDMHKTIDGFTAALQEKEALIPAEFQMAQDVLSRVEVVLADARRLLDEAEQQLESGRYAAAADSVAEAKQTEGFSLSTELKQQAQRLTGQIQQAEQKARKLYTEAVQAHQEGDVERVKSLISELESKYSHTQVYQKNQ